MSNLILNDFCKNLDKIGSETNKQDFINNYNNFKKNLDEIDEILDKSTIIDKKLDINDILILLNDLNSKNINYLTVHEIKYFKDLLELLEEKISNNKFEINIIKE
jgi:hypothetical protein